MARWKIQIPDEVIEVFASDPLGPLDRIPLVAKESPPLLRQQIDRFLDSIPCEAVAETQKDVVFRDLYGGAQGSDLLARTWFAERLLSDEISCRRLRLLADESNLTRPTPYETPVLADQQLDPEHLVPLSSFRFDGSRLIRNDNAYTLLSTTEAPNSTYWLLAVLVSEKVAKQVNVRPDPFLWGPAATFPPTFYRMLVYGRPLDWERISNLSKQEHGSWRPDQSYSRSECTEFCWDPRGNEIHFVCEEVPKLQYVSTNASRYLHAVYSPIKEMIIHLDGALRIYKPEELQARHSEQVRKSGKTGIREKVFRIDTPIPRDCFSLIAQAFFIWDQDVAKYFRTVVAKHG